MTTAELIDELLKPAPMPEKMLEGRFVTDETFIAALTKAAVLNPDFVYEPRKTGEVLHDQEVTACKYLKEDGVTGDCGVGVALIECGVNPEWLKRKEGGGAYTLLSQLGLSERVRSIASSFQERQDTGTSWGEALQESLTNTERYARRDAHYYSPTV
ncbi:hypothetical protein SEA_OCTOBIEN14_47 [Gordonia phage Octobien14]|uniref:Uncharacterized protein n=1 Tax=Gordonia phage Octobien14 TaxID=2483673 RepID=A0A3G3M9Q3_9CAUD|nr:hypothetical protein L3Y22_gp047 [Gordonia phage Octobien14]AYR03193.1 hypothetical protein SEA_OCTOBIEN14_47 [Gordonia phage Octobien14]